MFGSIVLDVVIGLVLVYLLYSLLATVLAEMISNWLGLRARMLRQAIERMLVDRYYEDVARNWIQRLFHPMALFFLYEFKEFRKGLAGKFYQEPSIKYLARGKSGFWFFFNGKKPSYIRPETFSDTLIRMMKRKGSGSTDDERIAFTLKFNSLGIQPNTLKQISELWEEAKGIPDQFREKLNHWYNEMMERLNGWFKRKIQLVLFLIGLVMAMTFNVDSISIARKLAKDKNARDQMVQMAISASDSSSSLAKALRQTNDTVLNDSLLRESYRQVRQATDDAGMVLGLGWNKSELSVLSAPGKIWYVIKKTVTSWQRLLGFIITALAISLGSNFWFDLLGKLVSIRAAGVKPTVKTAETTETEPAAEPSSATAGKPASVPPAHAPLTDPVSAMAAAFNKELMKIAGVNSVFKAFETAEGKTTACVRVNVVDEIARREVADLINGIAGRIAEIPVNIVVSGLPKTHQSIQPGQIANAKEVNGFGSIGCIVRDSTTGKSHLLSCWHVLKGNQNLSADDAYKTIIDHARQGIATRWAGGIQGGFDFGFARCMPGQVHDNSLIAKVMDVKPSGWRKVTEDDLFRQTEVRYYDSIEGRKRTGKILAIAPTMVISYPDTARELNDIMVITDDSGGAEHTISQPGNSGAMLFDQAGKALGMIIAGDSKYTYASRVSSIFDLYNEMQIL